MSETPTTSAADADLRSPYVPRLATEAERADFKAMILDEWQEIVAVGRAFARTGRPAELKARPVGCASCRCGCRVVGACADEDWDHPALLADLHAHGVDTDDGLDAFDWARLRPPAVKSLPADVKGRAVQTRKHEVTGRTVSVRSKTGNPACSAAMSSWKTTGMTPGIAAVLGRCRAEARALKHAKHLRIAGHEARAAAHEHRVRTGAPLTLAERAAAVGHRREKLGRRRADRAQAVAAARAAAGPTPEQIREYEARMNAQAEARAEARRREQDESHRRAGIVNPAHIGRREVQAAGPARMPDNPTPEQIREYEARMNAEAEARVAARRREHVAENAHVVNPIELAPSYRPREWNLTSLDVASLARRNATQAAARAARAHRVSVQGSTNFRMEPAIRAERVDRLRAARAEGHRGIAGAIHAGQYTTRGTQIGLTNNPERVAARQAHRNAASARIQDHHERAQQAQRDEHARRLVAEAEARRAAEASRGTLSMSDIGRRAVELQRQRDASGIPADRRPGDLDVLHARAAAELAQQHARELSEDDFVRLMHGEGRRDMAHGNALAVVTRTAGLRGGAAGRAAAAAALAGIAPIRAGSAHFSAAGGNGYQQPTAGVTRGVSYLPADDVYRAAHRAARATPRQAATPAPAAPRTPAPAGPGPVQPRRTRNVLPRSMGQTTAAVHADDEAKAAIKKMFGPRMTPEKFANMTGAPDGAKVTLFGNHNGTYVRASVEHPALNDCSRSFTRHGDGSVTIHNDILKVKKEHQGKGLGTSILARQVEWAHKAGVKSLDTYAYRGYSGSADWNGYITWPKLGYDGPIKQEVRDRMPEQYRHLTHAADFTKSPELRAAWAEHGGSTDVVFDLSPGSPHLKRLSNYIKESDARRAARAGGGGA